MSGSQGRRITHGKHAVGDGGARRELHGPQRDVRVELLAELREKGSGVGNARPAATAAAASRRTACRLASHFLEMLPSAPLGALML